MSFTLRAVAAFAAALTLLGVPDIKSIAAGEAEGTPPSECSTIYDVLLKGGRVVDGSGNPWFTGDLAINGDRIAAIGALDTTLAARVIDVSGLVIAPGFIDLLGQSEYTVLVDPRVAGKITQGITTEVTGEGGSVGPQTPFTIAEMAPILVDLRLAIDWSDHAGYFARVEKQGSGLNFAHLVGAAQVRQAVLKSENRKATPVELEAMRTHVARAMEQGAFGLSSSLIYPPGAFADTAELIALAKVAARHGGIYATHVRGESDHLLASLDEAATIGSEAALPVEIWHLKAAGRKNWGKMRDALAAIEWYRARGIDITADIYPYPAAATDLAACLPPWASEGGITAMVARLKNPAERKRIRREMETPSGDWEDLLAHAGGPSGVLVAGVRTEANRKFQGKRLSEIAAMRGDDPIEALFDLLVEENGTVDAIYFIMSEEDVKLAMASPFVAFNCDAPGVQPEGILGSRMIHPRSYGSFPRILGRYVREEKVLRLEDAIRKMTSLAAQRIGLRDRGLLRPGYFADVTVFDPAAVADRATFEAPHRYSEGIVHVFVNGEPVVESARITGLLPGRILKGPGTQAPSR